MNNIPKTPELVDEILKECAVWLCENRTPEVVLVAPSSEIGLAGWGSMACQVGDLRILKDPMVPRSSFILATEAQFAGTIFAKPAPAPTCVCGKDLAKCDADEAPKPSHEERARHSGFGSFTGLQLLMRLRRSSPRSRCSSSSGGFNSAAASMIQDDYWKGIDQEPEFTGTPMTVDQESAMRKEIWAKPAEIQMGPSMRALLDQAVPWHDGVNQFPAPTCTCGASSVGTRIHSSWCNLA